MPSMHPGWRVIGLIIAGVFFAMAARGIRRGRYDDPETGTLERAQSPILFWFSTLGLMLMGLYLLGVALGVPVLDGPTRH